MRVISVRAAGASHALKVSQLFETDCGSEETKADVASKVLDHLFDWSGTVLTVSGTNCMRIGRGL
jgi:hypothetical protein